MRTNIFLFVFCFDFCCRGTAAEMRAEDSFRLGVNAEPPPSEREAFEMSDTLYNSRARARIFADLLKGYL